MAVLWRCYGERCNPPLLRGRERSRMSVIKRIRRRIIQSAFLAGILVAGAAAQTFSGTITGLVTDPSGGAVPGATMSLTNTATQEVRNVHTEANGRYTFSRLLPSTYSLKVSHAGFREYLRSEFPLATSQSLELNVELSVGSVSDSIEVKAAAEMVDAQTANRSMTLTTDMVQKLPLNMRNALSLVFSSAGVVAARTGVSQATQDRSEEHTSELQ